MLPLRAELHIVLTEAFFLNKIEVGIDTLLIADNSSQPTKSLATISNDQLFTRLQELVDNQLRQLCRQMETIQKQRKNK